MFLESVEYTATLIEYVSRKVGRSVADVTTILGRTQVFDLCHNAPMNRLLPIEQISNEVISDNYLSAHGLSGGVEADFEFGGRVTSLVNSMTSNKHEYANWLFDILTNEEYKEQIYMP